MASVKAVGSRLKSFVKENVYSSERVALDTKYFGKFALESVQGPNLFRKRVVF